MSILIRTPGPGLTECHFKTFKEVAGPPAKAKRHESHAAKLEPARPEK